MYANKTQTNDALKNNIRTKITRIPRDVKQDHYKFQCASNHSDSAPGAWIEHIINYWAVLAKWWCTRKKVIPHKTCMSARQTYKNSL